MNIKRLKQNPFLRAVFYPYILVKRYFIRRAYRQFDQKFDEVMRLVRSDSLDIQLDEFKGIFSVGTETLMIRDILKEGGYETELTELIKERLDPSRDVIDIGANVGFFSVLFSKSIQPDHKVLCVEPSENALKRLYRNLESNGCSNVIVHEGALGSEKTNAVLHVVPGKEEYSSLQPLEHKHICKEDSVEVNVEMIPLDELIEMHGLNPGFIKMDVEGAEFEVLKGAKELLRKYQPTLLSEMDNALLKRFGTHVSEVVSFLEDLGYEVTDARTGGPALGGFSDNILAFSKSK